ncbi:MAG: pilus assembly PilX N-terminal domain-containing protein [Deltaproteobacteria bacterium]|nr:pilus assembly PilX N-terminal domain-containing protein [Candidatus Zymogenaceae bacterium]
MGIQKKHDRARNAGAQSAHTGKERKNTVSRQDRGYILMLCLIIMMTLTVIAVAYVINVSLETNIVTNYKTSRNTLNAAEAGLEVAMMITHEEITSQLDPYSGTPRNTYDDGSTVSYGYPFQTLFDDLDGHTVKYRVIPENPDPQKNRFIYRTYDSCQEMIHYAYPYVLEVVAEAHSSRGGTEYLKRQIRVLETPLVQYFVFFDDDLPWHCGPEMNSWGRVHSNGNIWFSPDPGYIYLKNFADDTGARTKHFLTASGVIYQDRVLGPAGIESRSGKTFVRVNDIEEIGTTNEDKCAWDGSNNCDYVEIDVDITSSNAEAQMNRFTDENDCTYLKVGAPKSPTIKFNALFREGFYEAKSRAPDRSEYFGITIVLEGNVSSGNWPPTTAAHNEVRDLHIYAATKDFAWDASSYPNGVKIEDVTTQVYEAGDDILSNEGEIVFCPETHGAGSGEFPDSDIDANYPVYLERNDQRQEMNGVALTVVNLEALEIWFFETYLDEQYDNYPGDNQTIDELLIDPLTGNPRKLVIYCSRTPTVAETSGVAGWDGVYTVDGGPPYPYYDDPGNQVLQAIKLWKTEELICATTFATDNPVYVLGAGSDSTTGFNTVNTKGCAVVADLVNLLSNGYASKLSGYTKGRPPAYDNLNGNVATDTKYCGAFFSGRDDLARFAIRGGPYDDETEGLHNFLALNEDWGGWQVGYVKRQLNIRGCLINLWFNRQALGLFECCDYDWDDSYTPPNRNFGWDPGYEDPNYWPPYCPSAYGVERVGWLEGDSYEEEFIWSPN